MPDTIEKAEISGELDLKLIRGGKVIKHQKISRDKELGRVEEKIVDLEESK